jgi:predicted SnoaL-like aldol condensation-catalyzing enzyme
MRMRNFSGGVLLLAMLWMGAAQAHNTPQEEANKKLVRDFYIALDDAQVEGTIREKIAGIIEKYIAVDYIQHIEGYKQGRAGMLETVRTLNAKEGTPPPPPAAGAPNSMQKRATLVAIMADGDRVIQVTSREMPNPATGKTKANLIWNMFRIEKGMLAEHWDSTAPGGMGQGMGGPGMGPGMGPPGAPPPAAK